MTGNAFQEFYPDCGSELTASELGRNIFGKLVIYRAGSGAKTSAPANEAPQGTLLLDPLPMLGDNELPLFPGMSGVFVLMPADSSCGDVLNG